MNQDLLFVKNDCPFCKEYLNWIDIVNSRLPVEKKIDIIDTTNNAEMEILDNVLIEKFKIAEVPCMFLFDGIGNYTKICGVSSREWIKGFLFSYYNEDFER